MQKNIKPEPRKRGRKPGHQRPTTLKKIAFETLSAIMQDSTACPEARAIAAAKIIDEVQQS